MEIQPGQRRASENPATLHCRVESSDTSPKLGQHPDSTNSTHHRYEKTLSSYDQCRVERKRKFLRAHRWGAVIREAAPLALTPQACFLGYRCLTKHPQIVSETDPRETNETQNSYEALRHSYKRCLTQHPNRIWQGHFAGTPMRLLVSTAPPNPALHGYTPTPTMTQPRPMCYIDGY